MRQRIIAALRRAKISCWIKDDGSIAIVHSKVRTEEVNEIIMAAQVVEDKEAA